MLRSSLFHLQLRPPRFGVVHKTKKAFNPNRIPGVPDGQEMKLVNSDKQKGSKEEQLFFEGYFGDALLRDRTSREEKISELATNVFEKGNRYIKSCDTIRTLPLGRLSFPEVCLVGNTGAGKSRLIAALLHNGKLGKGGKAGRTCFLQFFSVGDSFMIVDTPGYGEWNKVYKHHNRTVVRSVAQALTKQYICLRKHSNLKRVYLCVAADRGLRHRDKEFIRYLIGEGMPFTIVMTYLDALTKHRTSLQNEWHWKEVMAEIPTAAKRFFDELGTDQIPFIEVCARSGFNIDALQKDMVYQATSDIEKEDALTIPNFQQLSYSPPSAAAFIAAELRYPPEHELTIDNDDITDREYIQEHIEQVKMDSKRMGRLTPFASLEDFAKGTAPRFKELMLSSFYSAGDVMEGLPAATEFSKSKNTRDLQLEGNNNNSKQDNLKQLMTSDSSSSLVKRDEQGDESEIQNQLPASKMQAYAHHLAAAAATTESPDKTSSATTEKKKPSSILLGSKIFTNSEAGNKHLTNKQKRNMVKHANSIANSHHHGGSAINNNNHIKHNNNALLTNHHQDPSSSSSVFLSEFDDSKPAVTKPPLSLVADTVISKLEEVEKSPHRYKAHIENGWREVMDPHTNFFTFEHENLGFDQRVSTKKKNMLKKYIDKSGLSQERPLRADAQSFMNPFVGQEGASRNVVSGMDASIRSPSSVQGTSKGAKMMGLKQRGFGGRSNSLPDRTLKGRGRKTDKLHDWAK